MISFKPIDDSASETTLKTLDYMNYNRNLHDLCYDLTTGSWTETNNDIPYIYTNAGNVWVLKKTDPSSKQW